MFRLLTKTLAATLVSGTLATSASANLIFSQYTEGSGFFKAIEIYNAGDASVNLDDYKLIRYTNGAEDSLNEFTFTADTTLAAGDTWVIVSSSTRNDEEAYPAETSLIALADQIDAGINHNGDDPYALINTTTDTVADFLGQYGDIDFAKDVGYTRINFTPLADGVWDTNYWEEVAKDATEGFGEAPIVGTPEEPSDFVCGELTPIYAIQGASTTSPFLTDGIDDNEAVYTSGIVTSITTNIYKGFFLQDPTGDADPLTSDGIFVYTNSTSQPDIALGDQVCIYGTISEYYDATQVSIDTDDVEIISSGNVIEAATLSLNSDSSLHDQLEAYEGMLVTTTNSELKVSRSFSFDYDSYNNNMAMSYAEPIYKSTHLYEAGSADQIALDASNKVSTLIIETDIDAADGVVPYFSGFNAEDGYIRVGDKITGLEGVLGYSFSNFRLIVSEDIDLANTDFDHTENNRSLTGPELLDEGDLKVASFNVLNLFNSELGGSSNPFGSNRGADTQEEFDLQITKIANAIVDIDADIVGLMEIENNGFDESSAIAALINAINERLPETATPYSYITAGDYIGTDAIAVGLIYRADTVSLTGDAEKIDLPEQHGLDAEGDDFNVYQRVSLLQQFTHIASGKTLSVVVNHFKSKGSACIEDTANPDDVQGSCNEFRVSAAMALGDYLSYVDDNIIILGDLNSYGKEDPIRVLTNYDACAVANTSDLIFTAGNTTLADNEMHLTGVAVEQSFGFTNIANALLGPKAYSYIFDGELGSLDHALANDTLMSHIVSVADWHINSAESSLFQYGSQYTGDLVKSTNAYSSSDHDPVIVAIDFSIDVEPATETGASCDLDESGSITTSGYVYIAPTPVVTPTPTPTPVVTPTPTPTPVVTPTSTPVVTPTATPAPEESSSNGGGGSTDKLLLLLLSAIGLTRLWSRKK